MNITLSKEAQNLLHLAQENTKQPIEAIITKALANYLEDLAKKAKLNASEIK
ncbi:MULTISPECIES: hypothetical protein [Helicobacter]|uniref:hypothetical protein n=1 Tax=Helicobacter TaxID=209 RepID=UPI0025A53B8D|nr:MULTISPECIES: hypothetical protein [Helicobacter]